MTSASSLNDSHHFCFWDNAALCLLQLTARLGVQPGDPSQRVASALHPRGARQEMLSALLVPPLLAVPCPMATTARCWVLQPGLSCCGATAGLAIARGYTGPRHLPLPTSASPGGFPHVMVPSPSPSPCSVPGSPLGQVLDLSYSVPSLAQSPFCPFPRVSEPAHVPHAPGSRSEAPARRVAWLVKTRDLFAPRGPCFLQSPCSLCHICLLLE